MSGGKIISLFSGCGGLDLGFAEQGFEHSVCIESNPVMCESLKMNNISPNIICESIERVSNTEISELTGLAKFDADIVLGGPPCPAFSKSRFYRTEMTHGTDDHSFKTIEEYFRVVEGFRPKMFIFENVHTFAAKRQKGALEYVLTRASELGYNVEYQILNAADFGVPQKRQRIIIVGCHQGINFRFPAPTHKDPRKGLLLNQDLPDWRTAGDAISDLDHPELGPDLPGHFAGGKDHDLLYDIPPGDNYLFYTEERGHPAPRFKWRSRYWSFLLKLSPDLPSWTIQARRSNNMGPLHWRNRILTIDEVKRLQTFPDEYKLAGSVENQWRQVGNAVPPRLAKHLAISSKAALNLPIVEYA